MGEHEAFLRAILAEPDADGPRLVYADFLDETGDPASAARAELIRVQCAVARLPVGPERQALRERERELLHAHWREWFRPVREAIDGPAPDPPPAPPRSWLGRLAKQFRRAGPDSPYYLISRMAEGPTVYCAPEFPRDPFLTRATFRRGFVEGAQFLGGRDRGAERLGEVLARTPLRRLLLSAFRPEVLRPLAASGVLARLRLLALSAVDPDAVGAVVSEPGCAGLPELFLEGGRGTHWPNAAARVAASPHLRGLRRLTFDTMGLGDPGAEALASAPTLADLKVLELPHNGIGDAGARALAAAPHLQGLERLALTGNPVGPLGLRALRARFGGRLVHAESRQYGLPLPQEPHT